MPAGLLLVLAFGVRLAANRLAVGNLWRVQRQFNVIALAQFRDHHFDVLLPRARSRNSFVCGSRPKRSARSSSRILWIATPIRSSSARVFGSMANVIEGSGMRAGE